MIRRLLAAGGAAPDGPPVDLPPDPSLTAERAFVGPAGINQNYGQSGTGYTWRTTHKAATDSSTIRLAYCTHSQGATTLPMQLKVVIEKANGTLIPVTFNGGEPMSSVGYKTTQESDELEVGFGENEVFYLRTYAPPNQDINTVRLPVVTTRMSGDQTAVGTWAPTASEMESPVPIAIIGHVRPSTVAVGVIGDSIAAQMMWFQPAMAELGIPGNSYGRNATTFGAIDGYAGQTTRSVTHVLSEFSVNDLGGDGLTLAHLWDTAVAHYAHIRTYNPTVPIWQTTTTPSVSTTDGTTTLGGQTVPTQHSTIRAAWIAFLRDGAPCDPSTKTARSVGSTGDTIRMGQTGHPLQGFVDIAAAVEHGGLSGTGKWRVDLGPLGGDGVHPNAPGMAQMSVPVKAWLQTLTV